jgi:site-specific DNA recombinase
MHSKVYAYIRTSTVKQGTLGVSLEAQRDAIAAYARSHNLDVIEWFTETQTAAKQGRPIFTKMMKALLKKKAEGLVLHRLDRGSRNLRDWSDIADLTELGLKVHFAHDSLDLGTRGGRLAADVQAIVAADFIRNLRDECLKGMRGRLKQGIWPWAAPLGYVDHGKAQLKTIHPVLGALVREMFELYATGRYSYETISEVMYKKGLRSRTGKKLSRSNLSVALHCHYYYGLLVVGKWGEKYVGLHKPLITKELFDRVQVILRGRVKRSGYKHEHLYRRDLVCTSCGNHLIGETQKGHVYYRCHIKSCPKTSVKEESVSLSLSTDLKHLNAFSEAHPRLEGILKQRLKAASRDTIDTLHELELRKAWIIQRVSALADALLDGVIDKATHHEKKNHLALELITIEENIVAAKQGTPQFAQNALYYLELLKHLQDKDFSGKALETRKLVRPVTSNFLVSQKRIEMKWVSPFQEVVNEGGVLMGAVDCASPRTSEEWAEILLGKAHTLHNVSTSPRPPRVQRIDEISKFRHPQTTYIKHDNEGRMIVELNISKLQPGLYEVNLLNGGTPITDPCQYSSVQEALADTVKDWGGDLSPFVTLSYGGLTIRTISVSEIRNRPCEVADEMMMLTAQVHEACEGQT